MQKQHKITGENMKVWMGKVENAMDSGGGSHEGQKKFHSKSMDDATSTHKQAKLG